MDRRPKNFDEGLVKEYREGTLSRSRFCQAKGITVGLLEYAIQKVEKKEKKETPAEGKNPSFALVETKEDAGERIVLLVGKGRTEVSVRKEDLVRILREGL